MLFSHSIVSKYINRVAFCVSKHNTFCMNSISFSIVHLLKQIDGAADEWKKNRILTSALHSIQFLLKTLGARTLTHWFLRTAMPTYAHASVDCRYYVTKKKIIKSIHIHFHSLCLTPTILSRSLFFFTDELCVCVWARRFINHQIENIKKKESEPEMPRAFVEFDVRAATGSGEKKAEKATQLKWISGKM